MHHKEVHLPFLDHIRGFAILLVFIYHCYVEAFGFDQMAWEGWFRHFELSAGFFMGLPATFGWIGVPIFFVVSGFCIHLSYQRSSNKGWATFFSRRFFRIYPPYLVALLVFSFIYPWQAISLDSIYSFIEFGSHLLLVHNFDRTAFFSINPSFWSIAVEWQLYFLYPAVFCVARKFGWKQTLLILGLLELGIRVSLGAYESFFHASPPRWITGLPIAYWFSWSVGAATAEAYLLRQPLPFHRVPVWGFPILMILSAFFKPLAYLTFPLAALSTVSLINFLMEKPLPPETSKVRFLGRHIAFIAIVSYSIYLLHQPVVALVPRILAYGFPNVQFSPATVFAWCCITWIPVLVISWLFYRMLEVPSIGLGKALIQKASRNAISRAPNEVSPWT